MRHGQDKVMLTDHDCITDPNRRTRPASSDWLSGGNLKNAAIFKITIYIEKVGHLQSKKDILYP